MKRRALLLAAAPGTLCSSLLAPRALAQTPRAPRHVGVLSVATEAVFASSLQGLRDGLRERGHVEGGDIVIDLRYAMISQPNLFQI